RGRKVYLGLEVMGPDDSTGTAHDQGTGPGDHGFLESGRRTLGLRRKEARYNLGCQRREADSPVTAPLSERRREVARVEFGRASARHGFRPHPGLGPGDWTAGPPFQLARRPIVLQRGLEPGWEVVGLCGPTWGDPGLGRPDGSRSFPPGGP